MMDRYNYRWREQNRLYRLKERKKIINTNIQNMETALKSFNFQFFKRGFGKHLDQSYLSYVFEIFMVVLLCLDKIVFCIYSHFRFSRMLKKLKKEYKQITEEINYYESRS